LRINRRMMGGLIACFAAPVTAIAALSQNISRIVGISQSTLLTCDAAFAGILILLAAICSRRSHG